MNIDAIIAQLADNDEAARAAFRAMHTSAHKPANYTARHASTAVYALGVEDGFAVYSNGKSVL